VFHEEMSADVQTFLKNVLYVSIGSIISAVFVIIFTILGGRILGPVEYGKFSLIQTVASFLLIPMLLGFATAMLKYSSEKNDFQRQSAIIITTSTLVLLLTTVCIFIFIIFTPWLSKLFAIPPEFFHLAIIFAGIWVFYTIVTSALRGLNMMKEYSIFQIVYGSILLLSFFIFIIDKRLTFGTMLYSMLITYFICTLTIIVMNMHKFTRWNFERSLVGLLSKYALISCIGGISATLYFNVDTIMISRYLNIKDVGIYNAYTTISIGGACLLFSMFIAVFFPTISRYEKKGIIFKRTNKIIPYIIIFGVPFMIVCEFISLKFYGNKYPIDWIWVILASIASIGVIIEGLYSWILNSVGSSGAKISAFCAICIAVTNIGLNILLIPLINIAGGLLSTIISFIIGILILLYFGRAYLNT